VACADAGKHLYLDKSLAPSLAEARNVAEAARRADVFSHMFTFNTQPWAAAARQLVHSGQLGTLQALHVDMHFAKGHAGTASLAGPRRETYPPDPATFQTIEAKRELDNVGVYAVALIGWLAGWQFKRVYAVTANYFFREHERTGAEDFAVVQIELADGAVATFSAGRIGWTAHPSFGTCRVLLAGDRCSAVVDANKPRIELYDQAPAWSPPAPHPEDPMAFWPSTTEEMGAEPKRLWQPLWAQANDASYFIDRIEAGQDSEMSAERAATATEVLMAAYKSAATGELPLE
jgi:predicted dehydrogenase